MDAPDSTSTKIFFQNINGLRFSNHTNRWQQHLEMMKERVISISGLAETNTNWKFRDIVKRITQGARTMFPNSVTTLSSNQFQPPTPSAYQPGGCLQIATSHWSGRIIATITDKKSMGRWAGHTYRPKESHTISIITAYFPCKQTMAAIATSVHTINKQQATLIFDETGELADIHAGSR
jgi:hypothetical protein